MASEQAVELLGLMRRRHRFLRLFAEGTIDKATVRERIGVSQSTLDRAYREFEAAGVLTQTGETYRLTNLGACVCTELEREWTAIETLVERRDGLAQSPRDLDADLGPIDGATVDTTDADAGDPSER